VGEELQTDVKKVMKHVEQMILAIKAKGGWKYREQIRLSDRELEKLLDRCEIGLKSMAVYLVVAEAMLQEPAPSIHPRWEEYVRRREHVMAELGNK